MELLKKLYAVPAIHGLVAGVLGAAVAGGTYLLGNTDQVASILVALHIPPAYASIIAGAVVTGVAKNLPTPAQQQAIEQGK